MKKSVEELIAENLRRWIAWHPEHKSGEWVKELTRLGLDRQTATRIVRDVMDGQQAMPATAQTLAAMRVCS